MGSAGVRLSAVAALLALLGGCDELVTGTAPAAAPVAGGTATAPPALTREGAQVITLELRNGTDAPIVELSVVAEGRPGPNLLPPGMGIPPGGRFELAVSPGLYRLAARLQAAGPFAPGRQVLRNVQVPTFPPNPPPRMPVTLR